MLSEWTWRIITGVLLIFELLFSTMFFTAHLDAFENKQYIICLSSGIIVLIFYEICGISFFYSKHKLLIHQVWTNYKDRIHSVLNRTTDKSIKNDEQELQEGQLVSSSPSSLIIQNTPKCELENLTKLTKPEKPIAEQAPPTTSKIIFDFAAIVAYTIFITLHFLLQSLLTMILLILLGLFIVLVLFLRIMNFFKYETIMNNFAAKTYLSTKFRIFLTSSIINCVYLLFGVVPTLVVKLDYMISKDAWESSETFSILLGISALISQTFALWSFKKERSQDAKFRVVAPMI